MLPDMQQDEYDNLWNHFLSPQNVCAGVRESLTRQGTLRQTPRIVREAPRVAGPLPLFLRVNSLLSAKHE